MNAPAEFQHLFKLPLDERMQLAEALWDSIADDVEDGQADLPIPDWQREELERRAARLDAGDMPTLSWDEVKKKLRNPSA